MRELFGENVDLCENEIIGSRRGGGMRRKILYVGPPMLYSRVTEWYSLHYAEDFLILC